MWLRSYAVALALQLATCVFGQQARPDFSGAWKLNIEKSHRGKDSPLVFYKRFELHIQQSGSEIRIREDVIRTRGGKDVQVFEFKIDGRDYPALQATTRTTVSGTWDGDRLVERIRWDTGEAVRKMKLSQDGSIITAEWRFNPVTGMPILATEIWERE